MGAGEVCSSPGLGNRWRLARPGEIFQRGLLDAQAQIIVFPRSWQKTISA
jgi:hypothetical protein